MNYALITVDIDSSSATQPKLKRQWWWWWFSMKMMTMRFIWNNVSLENKIEWKCNKAGVRRNFCNRKLFSKQFGIFTYTELISSFGATQQFSHLCKIQNIFQKLE